MSMGQDVNGTLASGSISDADILPSAKGCADTVGYEINNVQDLMQALENGDIYANAHSMAYPDGVSRGQLEQNGSNSDTWNDSNNTWNDNANDGQDNSQNDSWSNDQSNWENSDSGDSDSNDNSDNSSDWSSDDSSSSNDGY
jgi:hypothetical protein